MPRDLTFRAATNQVGAVEASKADAAARTGDEAHDHALDIFRFFVKAESRDDLAIFGLTRSGEGPRPRPDRII